MTNKILDSIYGEFEIDNILVELINSYPMQRLKNIHQGGASYLVNKKWNLTRYDHSVGVMILIKLLGGSLEEQIAGLLHDISHTAFSHVVDFALQNKKEDYHEEIYLEVVENSQIPNILLKHGYNYKEILEDESKWTILEQSSPKLCADRIDYTLRDMYHYGYTSLEEVRNFVNHISVSNGEIVVDNIESAKYFVNLYYKEVIDYFMHPLNAYGYEQLSKLIRLGLDKNIIDLNDLLKTDDEVISILNSSNDTDIHNLIQSLNYNVTVRENKSNYNFYQKGKLRLIDPTVIINNIKYSLTSIDPSIEIINNKSREIMSKGIYVEIL
ncbi:MAG: HD domain-containing protein [Paraclostridium sp.]